MAIKEYLLGAGVVLRLKIKVAGVLTDPTTGTVRVRKPGGTIATHNLLTDFTKLAAGDYEKRITVDEAGEWNVDAETTGPAQGTAEAQFFVKAREF